MSSVIRPRRARLVAAGCAALAVLVAAGAPDALVAAPAGPGPVNAFVPIATYTVTGSVAEIAAATLDGQTLLYTDSAEGEVGFVNLADPAAPAPDGEVAVDGEPTAVAITPDGAWALVAINTSASFTDPTGHLAVIDLDTRMVVTTIELGGQPDSVAIDSRGRYAAIAIENERDEDVDPDGGGGEPEGGLPQPPAGWLAIVDLIGAPAAWTVRAVDLTGLPGLRFPADPEPEFVDIGPDGRVAVTLQENNAVAIVDPASGAVLDSWSTGVAMHTADLTDDDIVAFVETLTANREPDAIGWTPDGRLVTANEGDYPPGAVASGSRDFTIFTPAGRLVHDAGASFELAVAAAGLYPDGRSDNRGSEPEGIEIGVYGSRVFLFVGAERASAVGVYRLTGDRAEPRLVQVLETGDRPEGLVAIPTRGLFVSANEDDGTISIFAGTSVAGGGRS